MGIELDDDSMKKITQHIISLGDKKELVTREDLPYIISDILRSKAIEEKIGRKVRWELQFSKTSAGFQSGKYDFYFRGDNVGIDSIGDLSDTAESLGIVNRTGAWYQLEDGTKVQGREGFINRLREDLDLQDMIKKKLDA